MADGVETQQHAIETILLEERRYSPPEDFASQANAQPEIYDRDFDEFWETGGRKQVTWFGPLQKRCERGPAVCEVVPRRPAEGLLQLRRPACRVRQRRQDRLLLGRRAGGRAQGNHLCRSPGRRRPVRERAQEARRP